MIICSNMSYWNVFLLEILKSIQPNNLLEVKKTIHEDLEVNENSTWRTTLHTSTILLLLLLFKHFKHSEKKRKNHS